MNGDVERLGFQTAKTNALGAFVLQGHGVARFTAQTVVAFLGGDQQVVDRDNGLPVK